MSAETLREAARLMRERAENVTPGPWYANPGGYVETHLFLDEEATGYNLIAATDDYGAGEEAAAYIASWPPAVALAVADLLDAQAEREETEGIIGCGVAVARAYLGEVPA